jgi:hypothetical protein
MSGLAVEVVEVVVVMIVWYWYVYWYFLGLGGLGAFWAPLAPGIGKASCCSVLYKKWGFLRLGGLGAFWAPLAPGIGKASCCSVCIRNGVFSGWAAWGPSGRLGLVRLRGDVNNKTFQSKLPPPN